MSGTISILVIVLLAAAIVAAYRQDAKATRCRGCNAPLPTGAFVLCDECHWDNVW